ncbi:MAG TPA: molybdopterin cofactor-binding domain-containing protein [Bryobacteraceae bacterium]|nr:molybdopterin cofactor-binding domain-containing protein [Bryobacteraceae bacterium]
MLETPERIAPERYELSAPPAYRFDVDRRDFIGLLGGGLLVVFSASAQESGRGRGRFRREALPEDLGAWLHIGEDGAITVYTGKTEVGQNIRTSLSQAAAEELRCPIERVTLIMADTALTPFDMGTFGSRTTPTMAPQVRRAAATAREALLDLAAEKWKVDRAELSLADGRVSCKKGGQSASYGELAKGLQLTRTIPHDLAVARPLGESKAKVSAREIVTGRHKYTPDITRPGMLYGRVLRPPAFGATLISLDAPTRDGITVVHEKDFVGVAAPGAAAAAAVLGEIKAQWKREPAPVSSGPTLYRHLKDTASPGERDGRGSVEEGMRAADVKLQSTYTVAYIAHAPLEPRAAVAEWTGGKLTVWTGSQRPFGVRSELAAAFGIPEDRVRVIVPDTGSGYGGKHSGECAIEAARLAKAAGKPVKLVWSREEEFTWAYFRPAGVIEVSSGAARDGSILAWEFHNYNSGGSAIAGLYDIPHQLNVFHPAQSPLRQGSYRGLAATANHFAREVHIDELAHEVKMDSLAFRLKNIKDPRLRAVLQAAADRFGWGKSKGIGLACGFEKNGYVAACAQVAVEDSRIRIERVVEAFDCGAVVNPNHLKNQIGGAVSMALGGALFEQIRFSDGQIQNPRFSQYRVPRFSDMPEIEVVLVDRPDLPSAGAGETPIVGLAPAVSNAVFDLTGKRLRSMPLEL